MAREKDWVTQFPMRGDLYLHVRDGSDAYHVGFVSDIRDEGTFTGISGNTSADGLSSNGDRVAERDLKLDRSKHVFVRVPKP